MFFFILFFLDVHIFFRRFSFQGLGRLPHSKRSFSSLMELLKPFYKAAKARSNYRGSLNAKYVHGGPRIQL